MIPVVHFSSEIASELIVKTNDFIYSSFFIVREIYLKLEDITFEYTVVRFRTRLRYLWKEPKDTLWSPFFSPPFLKVLRYLTHQGLSIAPRTTDHHKSRFRKDWLPDFHSALPSVLRSLLLQSTCKSKTPDDWILVQEMSCYPDHNWLAAVSIWLPIAFLWKFSNAKQVPFMCPCLGSILQRTITMNQFLKLSIASQRGHLWLRVLGIFIRYLSIFLLSFSTMSEPEHVLISPRKYASRMA